MNLPFQSAEGSHNSALMFESLDGFSTSFTRQCAGIGCAACAGALPWPPGCTNGPVATSCALVIVTLGIETDFKDSHGAAATMVEKHAEPMTAMSADVFRFMIVSVGRVLFFRPGGSGRVCKPRPALRCRDHCRLNRCTRPNALNSDTNRSPCALSATPCGESTKP